METSELSHIVEIKASSRANGRRVPTGVEGFDGFVEGGFPQGSMILLAGTAGSGKTIFAAQYLYHGMSRFNESAVYMSLAEDRGTFMKNMMKMGMDFENYEQKGKFKFLDMITVRDNGVEGVFERLLTEVCSLRAKRVVIDSISALVQAFPERIGARVMLHTVLGKITHLKGVTILLIAERPLGAERLGAGMEEFVADGVITLSSITRGGWLTRTLQVLKLRGTRINSEEHGYNIDIHGIRTYPLPEIRSVQRIYSEKVPTGIGGLDKMLFNGVFKGSVTLVGGASGTGKTTFALHFVAEEARRNGRSFFVSFEEPEKQLVEHARGFGWNIDKFVDKGLVKFSSCTPEPFNVEQQLDDILGFLEDYRPARLAVDSIVALERVMLKERYLRYIKGLTLYLKDKGITTLFTALYKSAIPLTGTSLSASVDNIIALKHVEIESALRRAAVIVKARGSAHDNEIREFEITTKGVVVKGKFVGMEQILGGAPRKLMAEEAVGRRARNVPG